MDKKRKSVFSSQNDDLTVTRAKKNQVDHRSINTTPFKGQGFLSDADLANDVQNILDIVNKITTTFEDSVAKLSPEVLKAAKDLSEALLHTSTLNEPTTNLTCHDHDVPTNLFSGPSLPPLPRIIDEKLERAVFTHPGVSKDPKISYDRLEILGDAYIELMATKLIWNKFQQIPSGRISQIRELLVKNETLAEYTTEYGIDKRASVPHDYSSQPKRWTKTKGDIFEAYVAAVILSHPNGYDIAEEWLSQLWSLKLATIEESHAYSQAKEELAKKIMGKGIKLKYIDERKPLQHEGGRQTFFIGVYLTGWGWSNKHLGSGQGLNKTIAGNKAAQQALENGGLIKDIVASKLMHGTGRP